MLKLLRLLRYDWPLHVVLLMTNWLPDNVFCLRIRGWLARTFLGECGNNLRLGRNVTFYNSQRVSIGNDVYIAQGCILLATEQIRLDDEVMLGPYVVCAAGDHLRKDDSFRYGGSHRVPIFIGKGTWVAAHVTILAGAKIGQGCLVAANAAVRDGTYPDHSLLGGVPAKVIRVLPLS